MQNPEFVYRKFIEFEEQAAAIYFLMASGFSPQNPELAALWLDMGIQEKEHAGLLQFCLIEGLFAETRPSDEQVTRLETEFAGLSKRAAEPNLSVENAFKIAMAMETSEVNDIYSYLTTPLHASTYLLRRKIAASMPDHVERLLHEGRKHGVDESAMKSLERVHKA